VDAQDAVTALQLVSSATVLCYASLLDWRTRRVGNIFWAILSVVAILLLVARVVVDDAPIEYLLILVPVLALLLDVYSPMGESGVAARVLPVVAYGSAIILAAYLGYLWVDDRYFAHLLTIPIMMMLVVVMYMVDIVRGGADAKALIALSIMFPFYPHIGSLPLIAAENSFAEILFPFAFIILVNAAIIVAFTPIAFALRNLAAGESELPFTFVGYKLDAEEARTRQVWLMERMEDGVHRRFTRPKRGEDLSEELEKLVSAGYDRVWVTPKIPFIIPMAIALLFTTVVGNILVLITGL